MLPLGLLLPPGSSPPRPGRSIMPSMVHDSISKNLFIIGKHTERPEVRKAISRHHFDETAL